MKAKTVMVFGTFDTLHLGHIALFTQAKKYAETLIVVVGRDHTVHTIKGRPPIHTERERLLLVKSLRLVDKAILGDKYDMYASFKRYKPDVVALGYDQQIFVNGLEHCIAKKKLSTKIVRLKPYRAELLKSKKMKEYYGL